MTIHDKITAAHMQQPTANLLLLGTLERKALSYWLTHSLKISMTEEDMNRGPSYCGLKVVAVNRPSYLQVAEAKSAAEVDEKMVVNIR